MSLETIDICGGEKSSLKVCLSTCVWLGEPIDDGDSWPICIPKTFMLSFTLCFVIVVTFVVRLETVLRIPWGSTAPSAPSEIVAM